jgi:hypothetical protein
MRKEILKHAREFEEKIHVVGGVLATTFVLTLVVERWRPHGEESASLFVEVLHWVLIAADVVILLLFVGVLLFRSFGIAKPTRQLSRAIEDEQLNKKVHDWLAGKRGSPSPEVVRFGSEANFDDLTELNYEAFKDSVFEVEKEKLARRNKAWIKRNPRVLMLILDPFNSATYVGYSAMLPLTEEGLQSYYVDGAIKDADIPASFIAPGRAATAGVLIFAIYLKKEFSFQRSQASRSYSIYFLACVRRHLDVLFANDRAKAMPYPPVYVQTEYPAMKRRLIRNGFVETGKRSADGFDFLVIEHPLQRRKTKIKSDPQVPEQDFSEDWA